MVISLRSLRMCGAMKIAICDDYITIATELKTNIETICAQKDWTLECKVFASSIALLNADLSGVQVVFLDIDMPQMTGIQAAQRVREALPDVGLVFVSSCESMVFEAIKTTPLRFIRKARLEEELEEAVTALLNRYHSLKNYYDFCVNGNTVRLKLSEIYYFESAKHYVKIKTLQEDYMVRAKMADLEQIFNEKGFVRVQSGYIVNLRHVDRVRYKDVLMNNGECISISRDRLEDLKLKHLEFIRRENNL